MTSNFHKLHTCSMMIPMIYTVLVFTNRYLILSTFLERHCLWKIWQFYHA